MSAAAEDMLAKAIKSVGRMPDQDWKLFQLRSEGWDKVSKIMVKALDGAKANGVTKPLGKLQDLAFARALDYPEDRPLQTVALWLTDSRAWLEQYMVTKDNELRRLMERRGLMKPRGDADVAP